MRTNNHSRIRLLSCLLVLSALAQVVEMYAIVDDNGAESTQYLLSYETDSREAVSCANYEELMDVCRNSLRADCQVWPDSEGVTVEWKIENAFFYNYVYSGYMGYVADAFYWAVKPGMSPSSFIMTDDGEMIDEVGAIMVPASEDYFSIHPDKTIKDVSTEILEIETKDIGAIPLVSWFADKFDATDNGNYRSDDQERALNSNDEGSDGYLPKSHLFTLDKFGTPNPMVFTIVAYLGQYNPDTWNLKAVTRIKYRVNNASYLHDRFGDISEVSAVEADEASDTYTRIYDLMGRELREAQPGTVYIQGGKKYVAR